MSGIVIDESGCWLWQGAKSGSGYPQMRRGGVLLYVHRVMYEEHIGPIPDEHEIDHTCSVRLCVNPAHLEAVTHAENLRRTRERGLHRNQNTGKTHCKRGHEFDETNTYLRPNDGKRACRACMSR